jgi:hypothetical protein
VKRGRGEFRVVSRESHYISKLVPNSASSILRLSKLDIANSSCEYHQDSSIGLLTTCKGYPRAPQAPKALAGGH